MSYVYLLRLAWGRLSWFAFFFPHDCHPLNISREPVTFPPSWLVMFRRQSRRLTLAVKKISTRRQHFFMPNSGCWESRSLVYLGFQGCHCACPGPEKRPRASVFLGRPSQPSPREQGWRSASRPPGGRGPAQERPLKQGSYFRDLYRLERGRAAGFSKLLPKGSIIIWVH